MLDSNELRKGMKILLDGDPHFIVDVQLVKPGKGNSFARCKLRNLITGYGLERTWRSGEKVEPCTLDERPMEFLYSSGDEWHFMDTNSYEQLHLDEKGVGEAKNWLTENLPVKMLFFSGRPISLDLPNFVELQITECEPAVKGDTKTNAMKQAVLTTGATVMVPMFVDNGEWLRIDTRTGEYVERVKR